MGKQGGKKLKLHFIETDKKLKVLREPGQGARPVPVRRAQGERGTREVVSMPPPQQRRGNGN